MCDFATPMNTTGMGDVMPGDIGITGTDGIPYNKCSKCSKKKKRIKSLKEYISNKMRKN